MIDRSRPLAALVVGLLGIGYALTGLALIFAPQWFFSTIGNFPLSTAVFPYCDSFCLLGSSLDGRRGSILRLKVIYHQGELFVSGGDIYLQAIP